MAARSNSRQGVPPGDGVLLHAAAPGEPTPDPRPLPGGASNPSPAPTVAVTPPRVRQSGRESLPSSRPGRPSLTVVGREPLPGVFPVAHGDAVSVAGFGIARLKSVFWDMDSGDWAASCIMAGDVPIGRVKPVRR